MDPHAAMAPSRTADARSTRSAPVAVRASRCLHARLNASSCHACADACPTGALGMDAQGPVLQQGCTGCGRCQAACPTGALAARGFEGLHVRGDAAVPRVIDCLHGAEEQEAGTLRVPCLGGIADAQLLQLCVATPDHAVVLLDHGACAGCDSGGPQHPAADTVQRVAGWLREAGIAEDKLPRLRRRMARTAAAAIDPMQSQGRARRGFLGAIARPADASPAVPSDDQSTPRQQAIRTLTALAARHGGRVAPELLRRVAIGPDCQGLRICASTCPTGALLRYRDERAGVAGVSFDAADCVACGNCAAACPQQALRLLPGEGAATGRQVLTRIAQRECADCGARFMLTDAVAHTRCDRCRKTAALARAAFQTLFAQDTHSGARSASPEEHR